MVNKMLTNSVNILIILSFLKLFGEGLQLSGMR